MTVHLANLVIDLMIGVVWCTALGVLVWRGSRRLVPPEVSEPWPEDDDDN